MLPNKQLPISTEYSPACSKTIRTARSLTSGENFLPFSWLIAPPSQVFEPPTIPGGSIHHIRAYIYKSLNRNILPRRVVFSPHWPNMGLGVGSLESASHFGNQRGTTVSNVHTERGASRGSKCVQTSRITTHAPGLYRNNVPIRAVRFLRKMRGGAQAHLIEASNGHPYVVKFTNNPQHRRILINEWVSSIFLKHLDMTTPETELIHVDGDFLEANPEVYMEVNGKRILANIGVHFGSRDVGISEAGTYDFLPDVLLPKVRNHNQMVAMLAFDKWTGNADTRQIVFRRVPSDGEGISWVASMIDNGHTFGGPHWEFIDSAIQGCYFRSLIYQDVRSLDAFEPWLERIRRFPEEIVNYAVKTIPSSWMGRDEESLARLLQCLMRRRSRVGDLIRDCLIVPPR